MDARAKREWRRIVKVLDSIGLLTQADMAALAGYCQSYSRWVAAEKVIQDKGLTIDMPSGYSQPRPEVTISQKERQAMMQFGARLGLSPSDRGRMTLPEMDEATDDLLD